MATSRGLPPLDTRVEMFQKSYSQDSYYNLKAQAPRPLSNATEMFDTDFEEDDNNSFIEIEDDYSPRASMHSAGRTSQITVDSEDLPTPKSNQFRGFESIEPPSRSPTKSVEGPKGPHLFRISQEVEVTPGEEYYMTMSPMTPRYPLFSSRPETAFKVPPVPHSQPEIRHRPISTLTAAVTQLDKREVATWSPRQVASWMYHSGFEPAIVEKFEENDISGGILATLKFDDLKELDIKSLGQRLKLWAEIDALRADANQAPPSPTEIDCSSECEEVKPPKKSKSKRRRKPGFDDVISPLESVSIVGIEQLMPKPHKCSKGENCSRWKKQQRLIAQFKAGHPVSPDGGMILLAGDPGNPLTAPAVRPFSDAQPSVVASSDLLGPGEYPPMSALDPEHLAAVQSRDPQDNVKQFLNFQHVEMSHWSAEEPPTPPFEMFPAHPQFPTHPQQQQQYQPANYSPINAQAVPPPPPHQNLRALPRLSIPSQPPPRRTSSAMAFSPGPMERVEALSPDLRNPPNSQIYRFGTPASEMDVPVTAVNMGPIARDASQSVPPNMNYRNGPPLARSASRAARRPSFQVGLPSLHEDAMSPPTAIHRPHGRQNSLPTPQSTLTPSSHYSPIRVPEHSADDVNHSGWMKKRKTRMLRHEWHEHHFTLKGTRLAMHKDEHTTDTLEAIDIDDYAIACSSLSSSKLNSAFKAMNIKMGGKKLDEGAFAFQLIPAVVEKAQRLKKNRESMGPGHKDAKTHHFAVKSRDERIDWMRELMLAKALKQRGEGVEITVNGNMV